MNVSVKHAACGEGDESPNPSGKHARGSSMPNAKLDRKNAALENNTFPGFLGRCTTAGMRKRGNKTTHPCGRGN